MEQSCAGTLSNAPGRVLIVDDNPMNRDMLGRRLERQGHVVTTVKSGTEALATLESLPCDLVFLDVMMPEMDGYETLRRLKEAPALRDIPVIMISALDEVSSVVQCIELGAEDYLPKPFNPVLLRARANACLEKKRLRDREKQLFQEAQDNYRRLVAVEAMRDELTNMIVHDLRTPLTSLIAGLQTLEAISALDDLQNECLGMAIGGGWTLLGMINDLLDIHKMESGQLRLERRAFSIASLLDAACAQVLPLATAGNLALTWDAAPGLPLLNADEEKLRRVAVNLLGNALKFTPPGGKIHVSAQQNAEAGEMTVTVRDTGPGIPEEAFERIFEKFGQVESIKAQGGSRFSTGLGLTFCKMAVEAHGGAIHVESQLGVGSAFMFSVPIAQENADAAQNDAA